MERGYVLVTGGTGYIGSHVAAVLLSAGEKVLVVDSLVNSKESVLSALSQISGKEVPFLRGDLTNRLFVDEIFSKHRISAVMHFAALKSVGASCKQPLDYYQNNLASLLNILQAMRASGVHEFIFSSSATVYGDPQQLPIPEQHPVGDCANPYGRTKFFCEQILTDLSRSEPDLWSICLLRYFNPVGSHPSRLIGEDPTGPPGNLVPAFMRVLNGQLPEIQVFGDDYPTPDGTGVRDYIHVMDLAEGHLSALHFCQAKPGTHVFNLGTGRGYSVLEVLKTVEKVSGRKVPRRVTGRRDGDVASCYADASLIKEKMGWSAKLGLEEMCRDAFEFAQLNQKKTEADMN